jgi:tRNA-dihydrouridine synthase
MRDIVLGMSSILSSPLTLKMRRGYHDGSDVAHELLPKVAEWGAAAVTLHGRTRYVSLRSTIGDREEAVNSLILYNTLRSIYIVTLLNTIMQGAKVQSAGGLDVHPAMC